MIVNSSFKPAWWLSNPHIQTIAAKWLRRNHTFSGVKSSLETPDADFIDLMWTQLPERDNTQPIIVILHGLAGSAESHYAKGMLQTIKDKGWIGVLMHFRGCSGRPNRQGRSYHSGDTRDIGFLTQWLHTQYPSSPMAAIGYSLGGNVLTKYLAEHPSNPYKVATVVCAPLDLSSCSKRISQGFSKLYQKYLVDMLKNVTLEKVSLNLLPELCPKVVKNITTMWDFDQLVTAPINGFQSAEHYYQQASGKYVLNDIVTPSLFIHSADDPFLDHQSILPCLPLPPELTFEVCKKGGHVGFIASKNPLKPLFWLEHRIPEFLEKYL